ncbi:MAG: thioredoxin [bacterium]
MANLSEVNTANFSTEVLNSTVPVLVDFWAEWCGPCRALAPILEAVSTALDGKVKIVKLNVDQNQQLAMQYSVSSIPTMIVFKGGQQVDRIMGLVPKDAIIAKLSTQL